jgi:membrane dipeptidase
LGGTGDINAFLDHIDYIARKFGMDYVSIGTDVAYESVNAVAERNKITSRPPRRQRLSNYWPVDDALWDPNWNRPHQLLSLAWTNWPLFTVGLVKRGYSDKNIEKIVGRNILRVARAVIRTI